MQIFNSHNHCQTVLANAKTQPIPNLPKKTELISKSSELFIFLREGLM